MGTKKGQKRKTARRAYEKRKKKSGVPRSGWGTGIWKMLMDDLPNVPYYGTKKKL
tara:strand:- start:328 stop:492 length:165 start_codon:yes stop_codon:yes gene_type:complete